MARSNRQKTSDYYVVTDPTSGEILGRILDMSIDGFRLMIMEPLAIEQKFSCAIRLPSPIEGHDMIELTAESRWCMENERAGWYEAGFKFIDIDQQNLAIVGRLLQEWKNQETARMSGQAVEEPEER
jgi:hypothetical protein